jgi:hypothetical protein
MATITAESIIERATIIIQDETGTRWPSEELLKWLNDGQREVVMLKPDAYAQNESVALDTGTKQSLPADGISLIDVVRNMGVDGSTPGKVIRLIDRRILDDQHPDWHSVDQVGDVDHYAFDQRDPRHFYVWPPADGTSQVEVIYSAAPTEILVASNTISLDDVYANALLDYILYRAYSKDADYTGNAQRALAARASFMQSLGRQDIAEAVYNPNIPQQARTGNMMTTPSGGQ